MSPADSTRDPAECAFCPHFADHECGHCGEAVCPMHYDGPRGLCVECADRYSPDGRRGDTIHF